LCGIVGIADFNRPLTEDLLLAMRDRLEHRGPDDAGAFLTPDASVALGMRRLAILDLSPKGHQPMTTPDGRFTIVYNGEIYNYVELRAELERQEVPFTSDSDTEVLLHAYAAWGAKALDRLCGMFAFAIWDREERTLFLARDRVGKKPLLYYWDGQRFAFASEMKALLALPECAPRLDPEAVDVYFALGYIPAPLSIFRQVRKLPPGHYLKLADGQLQVTRYWFPECSDVRPASTREGRLEEFRALFEEAVRIRLRSDVPIGLFLSGGVDSSAVAAECVRQGCSLRAFTVAFDQDQTDLPFARQAAAHLGLEQEVIAASGQDLAADLARIVWYYDEPFADTSSVPSYYIAQATQGRFKVILNGDGGDEAFAGYRHYEEIARKQFLKSLAAAAGLKDGRFGQPWQVYFQSKSLLRRRERQELLGAAHSTGDSLGRLLEAEPFLQGYKAPDALHLALWGDRHLYLAHDLLYKMDIALMAHSIEGRSPFLDHRLLEWAQRLPSEDLAQGRAKKVLLRAALRGVLPTEILDRPKYGFGAPVVRWLEGPLQPLLAEYLPTPLLEGEAQARLLRALPQGKAAEYERIWALLTFAVWAQVWRATW